MKQVDLKEYLEQNDCYVYKTQEKEGGTYYYMRRRGSKTIAVVFPPKHDTYKKENVCHVCNLLDVQVPDWAQEAQRALDDIRQELQQREQKDTEGGH